MDDKLIGVIPAGGFGTRMFPYKGFKELIPVGYQEKEIDSGCKKIIPKVVAEYTIDNMVFAGATKIVMVLSEQKWELFRFFGNGKSFGVNLAYVCQEIPPTFFYGMPVALDTAYSWLIGHTVLMGMPDTIIEPTDCFVRLLELYRRKNADLTLGVFPTQSPCSLAPVVIEPSTLRVLKIFDKPPETDIFNTWNIAVWSDRFTEMIHEYVARHWAKKESVKTELIMSDVFNLAVESGLEVYAEFFAEGKCYDIASTEKLIMTKNQIEPYTLAGLGVLNGGEPNPEIEAQELRSIAADRSNSSAEKP